MLHYKPSRKTGSFFGIGVSVGLLIGCSRHPNAAEIAQINKAGGRVEIDPTDKSIVKAWLTKPTADDSVLDSVVAAATVRELYLSRSHVTDEGLTRLAPLHVIQKLDLFDTGIGDAGLANLGGLTTLTRWVWDIQRSPTPDCPR